MKSFLKWLSAGLLLLLIILLAGLATLGWWLPPIAESQAGKLLRDMGFEPISLSIDRLGYSGVTVSGVALERNGAEAQMRALSLDYSLVALLTNQQAENLVIEGLDVTLYLPRLIAEFGDAAEKDSSIQIETDEEFSLEPLDLPIRSLLLDDSSLTLESDGWRKRMNVLAFLEDSRPAKFLLDAGDTSDALTVSGTVDLKTYDGEATFRLRSLEPSTWQDFANSLDIVAIPDDLEWNSGPFEIEGAVEAKQAQLGKWTTLGSLNQMQATAEQGTISFSLFNFGASGTGMIPEKVWAGLFDGEAKSSLPVPVGLTWDAATLETMSEKRVYLKLEGWRLSGDLKELGIGNLQAAAGPIRLLVDGTWTTARTAEDLQAFGFQLMMPTSPIDIYASGEKLKDLGVYGDAGLRIKLSPAKPERQAQVDFSLANADISANGFNFSADLFSTQVKGMIPQALSANLEVKNGNFTWAEGAGQITGIHGKILVDNVLKPKFSDTYRLNFEKLSQGSVVIENGEINITVEKLDTDDPFKITVTAGGNFAGGRIAMRVVAPLDMESPNASVDLLLQNVSLEQLASLFPQFQGKIQGRVSGEIPIKYEKNRIVFRPGYLEMASGETGKFSYAKQGWLTNDPSLNPETAAKDKSLAELMKTSNGAAILTELAMRDLNMTAFRLDILKPGSGDRKVIIHIEGDGKFKDVKVPVIQDIRVGGDVKEAVNLLLQMNEKIEFQ